MMVRLTVRLVGDPAQYDAWMLSETKKAKRHPSNINNNTSPPHGSA